MLGASGSGSCPFPVPRTSSRRGGCLPVGGVDRHGADDRAHATLIPVSTTDCEAPATASQRRAYSSCRGWRRSARGGGGTCPPATNSLVPHALATSPRSLPPERRLDVVEVLAAVAGAERVDRAVGVGRPQPLRRQR